MRWWVAPSLHALSFARDEHWRPQEPAVLIARAAARRIGNSTGRRQFTQWVYQSFAPKLYALWNVTGCNNDENPE